MNHLRPHEKLLTWQKAYDLCLSVYRITSDLPDHERYGLISQMRRAAASVPINIAEGNAKHSLKDRRRFLNIAHGSLEELHCEARICKDLGFISEEHFLSLNEKISKTSYFLTQLSKVS